MDWSHSGARRAFFEHERLAAEMRRRAQEAEARLTVADERVEVALGRLQDAWRRVMTGKEATRAAIVWVCQRMRPSRSDGSGPHA